MSHFQQDVISSLVLMTGLCFVCSLLLILFLSVVFASLPPPPKKSPSSPKLPTNVSSFPRISPPCSLSTPWLHSLSLSLYSTSASSHHVNYTTVLFLYYSPLCYFCHPSLLCLLFATLPAFCQGLQWLLIWGGGGACTGAQFNNKWLFSVIWLA